MPRHCPTAKQYEKSRAIFLHLPKTGGTAFGTALKGVQGVVRIGHDGCAGARALVSDRIFERCFKFGIIRDPWERLVSLYHHDRRGREGFKESTLEEKQAGFEPWLEADLYPRLWKSAQDMWFEDGKLALDYVGRFEDLGVL